MNLFNTGKYQKEIQALRELQKNQLLPALRQEQIKHNILKAITSETNVASGRFIGSERRIIFVWRYYLIAALAGVIAVTGSAYAAEGAKPGDRLFPLEKMREGAQLRLTLGENAKARLQAQFAEERLEEFEEVYTQKDKGSREWQLAQGEMASAIITLKEVREKTLTSGNPNVVAVLTATIEKLEAELQEESLKNGEVEINEEDQEVKIRADDQRAEIKGQEIKIEGVLKSGSNRFTITVGPATYILEGVDLADFVGKMVKVEGTLSGSGNTVKIKSIEADSSGSGSGDDESSG